MKRCALAKEKDLQPGAPVIVRLFDSSTVQGTICVGGVMQTVAGTKIRVRSGAAVYLVNPEQITKLRGLMLNFLPVITVLGAGVGFLNGYDIDGRDWTGA